MFSFVIHSVLRWSFVKIEVLVKIDTEEDFFMLFKTGFSSEKLSKFKFLCISVCIYEYILYFDVSVYVIYNSKHEFDGVFSTNSRKYTLSKNLHSFVMFLDVLCIDVLCCILYVYRLITRKTLSTLPILK